MVLDESILFLVLYSDLSYMQTDNLAIKYLTSFKNFAMTRAAKVKPFMRIIDESQTRMFLPTKNSVREKTGKLTA